MTTPVARLAGGLALLGLATGCATAAKPYSLVEPRQRPIEDFYTVEPGVTWTSIARGKMEAWTIDGYTLQALRFFKGVADGEPLFTGGTNEDKRPRFRAGMAATEVAELIVETLYGGRLTPQNLRPAPFGDRPGFRFELTYHTRDGVDRQALVSGAVVNGRLHAIVYDGTALHHFARYRPEAERVIESVRFK